jgi:PHD/YefM family antitoxin component YafN of YafNO toxin-antitoxin module
MITIITATEARRNFNALLDRVQNEIIAITRYGKVVCLFMSPQLFESAIAERLENHKHNLLK